MRFVALLGCNSSEQHLFWGGRKLTFLNKWLCLFTMKQKRNLALICFVRLFPSLGLDLGPFFTESFIRRDFYRQCFCHVLGNRSLQRACCTGFGTRKCKQRLWRQPSSSAVTLLLRPSWLSSFPSSVSVPPSSLRPIATRGARVRRSRSTRLIRSRSAGRVRRATRLIFPFPDDLPVFLWKDTLRGTRFWHIVRTFGVFCLQPQNGKVFFSCNEKSACKK